MKRTEKQIMEQIVEVYGSLSPENLSCDGELPQYAVRQKYATLTKELRNLCKELGREVSEEDAWAWYSKQATR